MQYINPIEILQLQNASYAGSIDTDTIKREKRKLFAEIELSDNGLYNYNGLDITKSDCERVINELDNEEKKEFYYYLTTNPSLNNFLTTGNEKLFNSFSQESIYKIPEFITFINPFFSERFDKTLLRAFKANDTKLLTSILRTQILVNQSNINVAFKSVSNEIKNRIEEVDKITEEIKNGERECDEESIEEIVNLVKKAFPVDLINTLPSYFQSQINKIGSAINFLDLAIDKEFGISESSMHLMEHLLKLNIESVGKKTFESNFEITKRRYDEKIEEEKNAPVSKKWATALIEIKAITDKIEEKTAQPKDGENKIKVIDIAELNNLPSFADDIRNSYAYAYRSMSISIWNKHRNIDSAISVINKGLLINSSSETKTKLNGDLKDLLEIKKEKEKTGEPISTAPDMSTTNGIGTTIYGDTLYFVFFHIPIIPIARYSCEQTYTGYRFFGKLKLHTWQKVWQWGLPIGILLMFIIPSIIDSNNKSTYSNDYSTPTYTSPTTSSSENSSSTYNNSTPSTSYSETVIADSKYKGNQLKNGASPFNACFGKSLYGGHAKLTVKNGSASDAIICIYSVDNARTIRNSYIRANSNFTISSIPQGDYKIRVFYGNDWNPTVTNDCGGKGNFESNTSFSEFDRTEYFEDSDRGFTVASITLYSVIGGNASSSSIDKSKFFNK
jgi:hypothetical protein